MRKLTKKRTKKAGLPSGTLVYTGEKRDEQVKIHVIDFDEANFPARTSASIIALTSTLSAQALVTPINAQPNARAVTRFTCARSLRQARTARAHLAASRSSTITHRHVASKTVMWNGFDKLPASIASGVLHRRGRGAPAPPARRQCLVGCAPSRTCATCSRSAGFRPPQHRNWLPALTPLRLASRAWHSLATMLATQRSPANGGRRISRSRAVLETERPAFRVVCVTPETCPNLHGLIACPVSRCTMSAKRKAGGGVDGGTHLSINIKRLKRRIYPR